MWIIYLKGTYTENNFVQLLFFCYSLVCVCVLYHVIQKAFVGVR